MWFDTDDGNKLYRATSAGNDEVAANEWVAVIDDGSARARAGLTADGDVDRAVPTGKGGTGETNTNRFLNSGISISAGNNGVMTLNRGGYTADTTSITKSNLGLSYDDGATVGAVAGTNLKQANGTVLSDVDVKNDSLDIDTNGTDIRIKKGSTVIQSTTLDKGSVGLSNLASLDSTSSTKLGGIAEGATVGAIAGTNLKQANGTVLSDADVRNDDLQIDYSGTTVRIKKGATTVIDSQGAPDALKMLKLLQTQTVL